MIEGIFEDTKLIIVNLYTPNKDDPDFFVKNFLDLTSWENSKGMTQLDKIIVGDFNLILDLEKEKIGGNCTTHSKSVQVVKAYMNKENLIDVWLTNNPNATDMTWRKLKPSPILERLDLILMSATLVPKVKVVGIAPVYLSDHSIPWVVLAPHTTKHVRGFWRLNNSLLADNDYVSAMRTTLIKAKQEVLLKVKKWEWVKYKARKESIEFSKRKKRDCQNRLLIYEKKLTEYNKELTDICSENLLGKEKQVTMNKKELLKQIEKIEKDRDEILEYKTRGAMMRARKDWLQDGEKPTSYYLRLECRNYLRRNHFQIKTSQGNTVFGASNVLEEQRKFYADLYANSLDFDHDAFVNFTANLKGPKLTDLDKEMLDKEEITLEEVKKAVFCAKKTKFVAQTEFTKFSSQKLACYF